MIITVEFMNSNSSTHESYFYHLMNMQKLLHFNQLHISYILVIK